MTTEQLLVTLLLVLPLAGFGLTALVGRRLHTKAWIIAVPVLIATWAIAMYIVYQTLFLHTFGEQGLHFTLYEWVPAGNFNIDQHSDGNKHCHRNGHEHSHSDLYRNAHRYPDVHCHGN